MSVFLRKCCVFEKFRPGVSCTFSMAQWRCHLCHASFDNGPARARHMRNIWKGDDDPTRCDKISLPIVITAPMVPIVTAPAMTAPLTNLARRQPMSWEHEREQRRGYTITEAPFSYEEEPRQMSSIQEAWEEMLRSTKSSCSENFWRIFLQIHKCSTVAIDSSLQAVKKVFVPEAREKQKFPISKRALLAKMDSARTFWPQIRHTYIVDVSQFKLPSGTTSLDFKFVDPVWAWIMAARSQHPLEMHWKPFMQSRFNERFGGGIQYGKWFQQACRSLPPGSYPMCIGLHWDGTSAFGLSSSPVCICVGNTNSCDRSAQYCLGYMPHAPDERQPEFKKSTRATELKYYIRQKCAAAILRILEEAARRGVVCTLLNQENKEVERLLYPRLSSMNFDQPEAQSFFGMQNKYSCSKCRYVAARTLCHINSHSLFKCRRRKGYSAFRTGACPDVREIIRLYTTSTPAARAKLKRWGFNYKRQCCIFTCVDKLLVRIPDIAEVFPGVDYRDRMHAGVIFLHRTIFEVLDKIVRVPRHRRILDQRLAYVSQRGYRVNGTTFRRQRSIFSDVGMTAADKSCVLFMLSHVLGLGGDKELWPHGTHLPLTTAVAHVQLVLLALRGRRSYTLQELKVIFDNGYVVIFGALETVLQIHYDNCVREAQEASAPAPKRFKPERRDPDGTETEDTDDDHAVGGLGIYSHSQKCLTHQHWVSQVVSAGGFNVHCTQGPEASHNVNMHLASVRVRHRDENATQDSMLSYLLTMQIFDTLKQEVCPPSTKTRNAKSGVRETMTSTFPYNLNSLPGASKYQQAFIHSEARVSRAELFDLLCLHWSLPQTRASHMKLSTLDFEFGHQLVLEDGRNFWGTDSRYRVGQRCGARHDILRLHGDERGFSLCGEVVCFVHVSRVDTLGLNGFHNYAEDLVLVRWLEPHASVWQRDESGLPLCPGPLHINNCLWRYARTARPRRVFVGSHNVRIRSYAFRRQKCMFGSTDTEISQRYDQEKFAYYGLVEPGNIVCSLNMCNTFEPDTATPVYDTWLHTVNMI